MRTKYKKIVVTGNKIFSNRNKASKFVRRAVPFLLILKRIFPALGHRPVLWF